jgi:hypothetical protein
MKSFKRGAPFLRARLPRLVLLQALALPLQHGEQRLRTLENLEVCRLGLLNGLVIISPRGNHRRGRRQNTMREECHEAERGVLYFSFV